MLTRLIRRGRPPSTRLPRVPRARRTLRGGVALTALAALALSAIAVLTLFGVAPRLAPDSAQAQTLAQATTFMPNPNISTKFTHSQLDFDLNGINDFSANNVLLTPVRYVPTDDSPNDCVEQTETYRFQDDSTISVDGTRANLIDRPAGVDAVTGPRCEYEVRPPDTWGDLMILDNDEYETVSASDPEVPESAYNYGSLVSSSGAARVRVAIPWIDDNDNNKHDWGSTDSGGASSRPTITFRLSAVEGASRLCRSTSELTVFVKNENTGEIGKQGVGFLNIPYIYRPGVGDIICRYAMSAPATVQGARLTSPPLFAGGTPSQGTLRVVYEPATFTPDIDFGIPEYDRDNEPGVSVFTGAEIDVTFTHSGGPLTGCSSPTTLTYTIQDDRSATTTTNEKLINFPPGVDRPCGYTAEFEEEIISAVGIDPAWRLVRHSAASQTLTYGTGQVQATYHGETQFLPLWTITVPLVDTDDDGDHDYAGTGLGTVGQANIFWVWRWPGSQSSCGYIADGSPSPFPFTGERNREVLHDALWIIRADGTTSVQEGARGLIDRPLGNTSRRCQYTLRADGVGAFFPVDGVGLTIDPNTVYSDGDFVFTAQTPEADYPTFGYTFSGSQGGTFFTKKNVIYPRFLKDDGSGHVFFAGVSFSYNIRRDNNPPGCNGGSRFPDGRGDVIIANDGRIRQNSNEGHRITKVAGNDEFCVHRVRDWKATITSKPGVKPAWTLRRQPGWTESVTGENDETRTATVRYVADAIMFEPRVSIGLPFVDVDGNGENDYAGEQLRVTYNVSGSLANCTSTEQAETYAVGAGLGANGRGQATLMGSAATLVDRPQGEEENRCEYTVDLPDTLGTGATALGVSRGDDGRFVAPDLIDAQYGSDATFTPTVSISVTDVRGSNRNRSLFEKTGPEPPGPEERASTEIDVTFQRAATADRRCSAGTPITTTFKIDSKGRARGSGPSLVGNVGTELIVCTYDVTFEPSVSQTADLTSDAEGDEDSDSDNARLNWTLTLDTGATASVTAAAPNPSATYTSSDVTYLPRQLPANSNDAAHMLTVPSYNGDDDVSTTEVDESMLNAFAGTLLRASFTSSQTGCTDVMLTFTVADDGSVAVDSTSTPLVGNPAGSSTECEYAVAFDNTEVGGTLLDLQADSTTSITRRRPQVRASYLAAETTFTPSVAVSVPYVDASGSNALATQTVEVAYASEVTLPRQHDDCTDTATETYTIDTGGTVANGGVATLTSAAAVLVDRPATVDRRCEYTATFSPSVTGGGAGPFEVETPSVNFTKPVALTPTYSPAELLTADIDIAVPRYFRDGAAGTNFYEGEVIPVDFAPVTGASEPSNCSPATTVNYVVRSDGIVVAQDGDPKFINVPDGQPGGATANCSYTVTFREMIDSPEGAARAWRLHRQGDATATITMGATTVERTYEGETWFVPPFSARVEWFDVDDNDVHDYSGLEFKGAGDFNAHMSPAACGGNAVDTDLRFVIADNRSASPKDGVRGLLDRPQGSSARCQYRPVLAAGTTQASPVADSVFVVSSTHANDFTFSGATAAADYFRIDWGIRLTYWPIFDVTYPQYDKDDGSGEHYFTGARFAVEITYDTSPTGCGIAGSSTAAQVRLVINADGTLTSSTPLANPLVYKPEGERTARCEHTVAAWSSPIESAQGVEPAWTLTRQDGWTTMTSGESEETRMLSVTYHASQTAFAPSVTIDLPFVDGDTNNANDYSGEMVMVEYERASDADSQCTASATETYTVQDGGDAAAGGETMLTSSAASLVDRPSGVDVRCRYDVDFTNSLGTGMAEAGLIAGDADVIDAVTPAAARFEGRSFAPNIAFTLPQYDRDGATGTNFYEGIRVPVDFTRAGGPAACGDQTVMFTVQADGTATTSDVLPDVLPGETDACEYMAAFAEFISSDTGVTPAWRLARQGAATAPISSATAQFTQEYHGQTWFVPPFSVTVESLDLDDDDADAHDWAGQEFVGSAAINADSASPTACGGSSVDTDLRYVIATDGTVSVKSGIRGLIDRPMGSTTRCQYQPMLSEGLTLDVEVENAVLVLNTPTTPFTFSAATDAAGFTTIDWGIRLTYMPIWDVEVPQFAKDDGSGDNYFAGARVGVQVMLDDDPATCGRTDSITTAAYDFEIRADGTMRRITDSFGNRPFIHKPEGSTTFCEHTVAFDETIASAGGVTPAWTLRRQSGFDATTTGTNENSRTISVEYRADDIEFAPVINFDLPYADTDSTSANDYAMQTITVTYSRVAGSNNGCTVADSETYTIQTGGSVADGGVAMLSSSPASLVDRPSGQAGSCRYGVIYSPSVGTGANRIDLFSGSGDVVDVLTPGRPLYLRNTPFTPQLNLTLPDYARDGSDPASDPVDFFAGQTLTLTFAPTTMPAQHADCSSDPNGVTGDFVVQNDGSVLPADSPFELVDVPFEQTAGCVYDVTYPSPVNSTAGVQPGWTLTLDTSVTPTATVSAAAPTASATYTAETTFSPTIAVAVPLFSRPGETTNRFSGTVLRYFVRGVGGSAEECSDTTRYTHEVGVDGSVTATDPAPVLVDRPDGSLVRCSYVVSVERDDALDVRGMGAIVFDAAMTNLAANYDTAFRPNVDVSLPDYARDGTDPASDPVDFFAGQEFSVDYTPVTGSHEACEGVADARHMIVDDGSTMRSGFVKLIDYVAGTAVRCSYDVTFQATVSTDAAASPGWTLTRDASPAPSATVHGESTTATVSYSAMTTFVPAATLAVPFDDGDGDGSHDLVGTTLTVTYTRLADAATTCTPMATDTFTVDAAAGADGDASFTRSTPLPSLVDRPSGVVTPRCRYSVDFPDSVGEFPIASGDGAEFDAVTPVPAAFGGDTTLTPTVTIRVPNPAKASAGVNDYSGTTIDVTFARASGPETGCSAVTETFTIQDDGSVTGSVSLVGQLEAATQACTYTATFEPSVTANDADATVLMLAPDADVELGGTDRAISADYRTLFTAPVAITAPTADRDGDSLVGATFRVGVAQSGTTPAGCSSSVDVDYELAADGTASPSDGPPQLVDRPPATEERCAYTVALPDNETGGAALARDDAAAASQPLDATTTALAVAYELAALRFAPAVTVWPPYVDANGANAFAGQTVAVDYALAGGATQHSDCTASSRDVFTIGDGGTVAGGGVVTRTTTASLVDYPQGETTQCRYVADFTDTLSAAGRTFDVEGDEVEFAGTQPLVANYSGHTFLPLEVMINVPQYGSDDPAGGNFFAGASFRVPFERKAGEGPSSGCTADDAFAFVVNAQGETRPTGGTPLLIDVPDGESLGCVYTLTFPGDVSSPQGATPAWTLRRDATQGAMVDVRAGAASFTRDYVADESSFAPSIAITVPPVLGPAVGAAAAANVFAGTEFTVRIDAAAGSHDECSAQPGASIEAVYTVGDDGMVTGTPPASLVDRPAGQEPRCEYAVVVEPQSPHAIVADSASGAMLRWQLARGADATTSINGGSVAITASYTLASVTFTPTVAITVPTYLGDDDPATVDVDESTQNAFIGRTFDVQFTDASGPASGSMSGCEAVTATYVVGDGGAVVPRDGEVALAHYADDARSTACAYDVAYPASVGADPALEREATGLDADTQASDAATGAAYLAARSTFEPAPVIVLPFVDASPADDSHDLAGETITVTYTLEATVPAQSSDCTVSATEMYEVAAASDATGGGVASLTGASATLTDRPARQDDRCSYEVTAAASAALAAAMPTPEIAPSTIDGGAALTLTYRAQRGTSPTTPPSTPPAVNPQSPGGSGGRTSGTTRRGGGGGGGGGSSRAPRSEPADEPAGEPTGNPAVADGPFAGYVASTTQRVPVRVSVAQPDRAFAANDTIEVHLTAPGACGADVRAFGGLPASIGVVFALRAAPNAVTKLFKDDAYDWAAIAQRGTQQQPCTLRVTLLAAPAGCRLTPSASTPPTDGTSPTDPLTDDAGRSYAELTWNEGTANLTLTPTLTCTEPT